jgi:(E)-2-((N-methylformamido)methylene)succinate hydrolase
MTWKTRQRSDFAGLSAIVAGSGPKILLIHGVGLRAEAWNQQIDALSARYHTIAVDMPGHGESACPTGEMVLSDYTDAIAAGLESPVLVVGHSMGAMIALDLASRFPALVQGVAALNAVFERSPEAAKAVAARAASFDGVSLSDPEPTLKRWFVDAQTSERQACGDWLTTVDPEGYRLAYTSFARENGPSRKSLAVLACPALFMTGGDEPNSTPDMSQNMATHAPKGRAIIVENAAHMMPMTHSHHVNAALSDFASEVWA